MREKSAPDHLTHHHKIYYGLILGMFALIAFFITLIFVLASDLV